MPASRSPLTTYQDAAALRRDTARQIAALIADTLTALLPGAAYLVVGQPLHPSWLTCVLDADGAPLHSFEGKPPAPLPALPPGHPLRAGWTTVNPCDPDQLQRTVTMLLEDGMVLDQLPEDLPYHHRAPGQPTAPACLLLSPTARPDHPGDAQAVLRPYPPADQPAPLVESPLSDLLTVLDPWQARIAAGTAAELYHSIGDPHGILTPDQIHCLTLVENHYREDPPAPQAPGHGHDA